VITCRELTDLVTDYLEGGLSWWQWLNFELHVGMCPDCRSFFRQVRETRDALGKLPPVEIPPDVERELLEKFRAWIPVDRANAPEHEPPA
jgi:predicted anti-sigma-YlaC factor YlaD